ncbi:deoxyuridine 5'-triphosphate nucleotidohydrolase (plasmid) [Blattabacterium sp. (Blattella germanica) str. Bge]|uniref:dUTP diphosphatase n=1 Tax=Blattabacterium sp. (Blattella germanica) TaxID=624186 RepID=UPI000212AD31|nr:dUTP diphosphatase [Blattabacterium sp. (Blattella germanica)]AEI38653.1 deoxyuridine 5'-triphosphate nucleotidohydrolase [Blattabacterium sp. (Blattella germanica) str. Bge]
MCVFIKICNISENPLPNYATDGSSGMDLQAFLKKSISIHPMERKIIRTGLFIEIPIGYEGQIRPRSGLAFHHGITVFNNPGTIDSDYRGEIKVLLLNLSNSSFVVENGNKIAQIIFIKYNKIKWIKNFK